jgi:hypothetical protein
VRQLRPPPPHAFELHPTTPLLPPAEPPHRPRRGSKLRRRAPLTAPGSIRDASSNPASTPTAALPAQRSPAICALSASLMLQAFWCSPTCESSTEDADAEERGAEHEQAGTKLAISQGGQVGARELGRRCGAGSRTRSPYCVAAGDPGVLEAHGRCVRLRSIGEEREYELLLRHR